MKALICLLSAVCLAVVQPSIAAEPAPAAAQRAAPAEAPDLAKVREAVDRLEREPGSVADAFLSIYQLASKAEQYAIAGDTENAISHYAGALTALEAVRKRVPDWNPPIVEYRTKKVRERLAALNADRQREAVAAEQAPGPAQKYTPAPPLAPPGLKAPPGFLEENRERSGARKWTEREFNKEKVYVVPLMISPNAAGY